MTLIDISNNHISGPINFSCFSNLKNSKSIVFTGDTSVYCDTDIYCQQERQEIQNSIDSNDYMIACYGEDRTETECTGQADCELTCRCSCASVLTVEAKEQQDFLWHVLIPGTAFISIVVVLQVLYCAWDGCMVTERFLTRNVVPATQTKIPPLAKKK